VKSTGTILSSPARSYMPCTRIITGFVLALTHLTRPVRRSLVIRLNWRSVIFGEEWEFQGNG